MVKIKLPAFNAIISILIFTTSVFAQNNLQSRPVSMNLTTDQWRQDLRYMVSELEIRHADLYGNISRENFKREVKKLSARIPKLSSEQIIFEFARLTVLIRDGHTGIFLPHDRQSIFRRYPIEVYPASDGWLILAAAPEYANLIGTKIKSLEQTNIEKAFELIEPVMPRDNAFKLQAFFPSFLVVPEILSASGAAKNVDELTITVEDAEGKLRAATLKPVARNAKIDWQFVKPQENLPLWLKKRGEKFWFTFIEDKKTVYAQFNSADVGVGEPEAQFIAFANDLAKSIESNKAEKLIIDLRWNSGGNTTRTRHILYSIIKSENVNRPGHLFTITSGTTYSAAVWHALRFEQETETLFVGTPPGGRPNHSGELRRFRLPHSNWEVRYSAVYDHLSDPTDNRPTIFPDLLAPLSSGDYRSGRDPALEAIFNYQPKQPIADLLRKTIEDENLQAALEKFKTLKRTQYNTYDFGINQLNSLGQELLNARKTEEAITIFELNSKEFPYSAWVYDSLARAYQGAGKYKLAIENYEKAFAIDKRYSHTLEIVRELRKKSQTATKEKENEIKSNL